MEKDYITIREASQLLSVSQSTIRNLIGKRTIPSLRIPGMRKWFIDRKALEKILKNVVRYNTPETETK